MYGRLKTPATAGGGWFIRTGDGDSDAGGIRVATGAEAPRGWFGGKWLILFGSGWLYARAYRWAGEGGEKGAVSRRMGLQAPCTGRMGRDSRVDDSWRRMKCPPESSSMSVCPTGVVERCPLDRLQDPLMSRRRPWGLAGPGGAGMLEFKDVQPGVSLEGVEPSLVVTVAAVVPLPPDSIQVIYRLPNGALRERLIGKADAGQIKVATTTRPWSFNGNGEAYQFSAEAKRIDLAFLFDPMMAVHTSNVDPLPHQITAVYESMLPWQPLRYVLADDPIVGRPLSREATDCSSVGAKNPRADKDHHWPLLHGREWPRLALRTPILGRMFGMHLSDTYRRGVRASKFSSSHGFASVEGAWMNELFSRPALIGDTLLPSEESRGASQGPC